MEGNSQLVCQIRSKVVEGEGGGRMRKREVEHSGEVRNACH